MSSVDFPELRARLRGAAESLCDPELQDRLWRRGARLNEEEPGFDDAILVVIDELDWSPPTELVGYVLRDDSELFGFRRLYAALDKLVLTIGKAGTFEDAIATGATWQEVQAAAKSLSASLGGDSSGDIP